MNQLTFSYKQTALVSDKELKNTSKKLSKEVENMNLESKMNFKDDRSSINLPLDKNMVRGVKEFVRDKLKLNPKYIIVIGIGGSNLGTMAIQEAVLGKLYNQLNPKIKVLYADTVDSDSLADITKLIESVKGNVILNVISKSGTTTETVANFDVLLNVLRKYKKNPRKHIVATTDFDSKLWNYALVHDVDALSIPNKVGGRYSVFSPVGLFPLGMLGINLDKLLQGAADMRKRCLDKNLNKNPAVISASLLYLNCKKGRTINDNFIFSKDLESVGKWYRQLMGESIGKRKDLGITPTVSIGSIDLHSMAQLYLGGPRDKFTTFISLEKNKKDNPKLKRSMDAIIQGTKTAFKKGKIPHTSITLQDKSEYSMGQLLQFKMMEMMYLGVLFNVNPFDQPNVEDYKSETRKLLSKKK